jgi:uncharacterized protein
MICLPDVNVWIAMIVAEHVHHKAAIDWNEAVEWDTLIFSRVTQMGFLRLLTNRHVMGHRVRNVDDAWAVFDQLRRNRQISFVSEPPGIENLWRELTPSSQSGSNFWTDAYLAAFAKATGYTLVTFDRGFASFRGIPLRILSDAL